MNRKILSAGCPGVGRHALRPIGAGGSWLSAAMTAIHTVRSVCNAWSDIITAMIMIIVMIVASTAAGTSIMVGRDYYEPGPRGYRESYPDRRASSPVPIIAGSVIGGVVGHELGRGNPGDTAVGAVIGTIIGYEIVRNR